MHRIELHRMAARAAIVGAAGFLAACAGPAPTPSPLPRSTVNVNATVPESDPATLLDARVAQRCAAKAMPSIGAEVASIHNFRSEDRARASRLLGIDRALQVVAIEAGSPADAAGLRPGDRVEAVNGTPVPPGPQARRIFLAAALDGNGHADGGPVLRVRRDGQTREVVLQSRRPCTVSVEVPPSSPRS
jgi:membrane-associated protease RseP (regulator of RpoE activity)